MAGEVTQIQLPDGTVVWAHVAGADQLGERRGAYSDTGLSEQVAARVEGLHDLVLGVTRSVFGAVRQVARPDEVSVSFGIELAARPGKVVGLLAEAEGKAAINVTLAWKRSPEEDGGAV
ncbi:hypothetical protein OG607_14845 [Streptomyces sp. NBC_01537]|uniref:CU044_2847 family protein n=1 Tax=Streptomyces sp. NBC_01537 TaxID=2903896 RepID=UPI00386E0C1A